MNTLSEFILPRTVLVLILMTLCNVAHSQSWPEDGDYFIVNVASGRALTPVDGGINSNTRLKPFNKSGMQKWKVKKYVSKDKNGNEIYSYTIQNVLSKHFLRPHHVPSNGNAIVSHKDSYGTFYIEPFEEMFVIKNIKMGGDVMYSRNTGFSDDEPWFGPDEGENEYRWEFILAE